MPLLEIDLIPMLSDNYGYLVREPKSGAVAAVDPAAAEPVLKRLEAYGGRLDVVLATHHHADHVAGIPEIKRATGCRVVGPAAEADRLPPLDQPVAAGDRVRLGEAELEVLETPGHTAGHVAFWSRDAAALFCGDTLFVLGCGRILEGTAGAMWSSLQKLAALPPETAVYCGHEYTQANAKFARHIAPDLPGLAERAVAIETRRAEGRPTVPSTIGDELAFNPFLRAGDARRFAELRAAKDRFR